MKSFGQEFYPHEATRALRLAEKLKTTNRRELTLRIAQELPHPSDKTRQRLASKFIQRYLASTRSQIVPAPHEQPFARLVSRLRHTPALVQLLYYELCKTDELVGILARELFYPVLIEGRAPGEYSDAEFSARNGSRLFEDEALITREFVLHHARDCWNFADRASVDRALRVLMGAGLIARERMMNLSKHPSAFCLAEHDLAPVPFTWAFYDEFLPRAQSGQFTIARSDVLNSRFARTFLLNHTQVSNALEAARRNQLLAVQGDQARLVFGDKNSLVETLIKKAL